MFLFFPVLRRGSKQVVCIWDKISFYSSPSCDGDQGNEGYGDEKISFYSSPSCDGDPVRVFDTDGERVSILPRLATGILGFISDLFYFCVSILPRLATGIIRLSEHFLRQMRFYSSPSCDGDRRSIWIIRKYQVSILPRLATGIRNSTVCCTNSWVSILPRLATGIVIVLCTSKSNDVSILPRLATGIKLHHIYP